MSIPPKLALDCSNPTLRWCIRGGYFHAVFEFGGLPDILFRDTSSVDDSEDDISNAAPIEDYQMLQPLYSGTTLTAEVSWTAIMNYAVTNKLSYEAIKQLLELLKLHCPRPSLLPDSVHILRTHFTSKEYRNEHKRYCSECLDEMPSSLSI